jgi:hypothetical protein
LDAQSPSHGIFPDNPDGAEGLRKQAAACRRLAAKARTKAGITSMSALADHFDEQARRADEAESASTSEHAGRQGDTR